MYVRTTNSMRRVSSTNVGLARLGVESILHDKIVCRLRLNRIASINRRGLVISTNILEWFEWCDKDLVYTGPDSILSSTGVRDVDLRQVQQILIRSNMKRNSDLRPTATHWWQCFPTMMPTRHHGADHGAVGGGAIISFINNYRSNRKLNW